MRTLLTALSLFLALGTTLPAQGQEWARKMFEEFEHDFGSVARSAKVQHSFTFKNIYTDEIHVASVRTSCGCTTPTITQQTLATYDTSEIVATFNTHSFLGQRGATITVTIDRPYYAEVQLRVRGFIRSDVTFNPGVVNFGEVDMGAPAETTVRVNYTGSPSWRIADVQSANPNLEVSLSEPMVSNRGVAYDMTVRLQESTAAGFLNDELLIVSNESQHSRIPLTIEGRVNSPVEVSPASLFLGVMATGEAVTKRLIVRGREPFRVLDVVCENPGLSFEFDAEALRTTHVIPVQFTAGTEGVLEDRIRIVTSFNDGLETEISVRADVKAAEVASAPGN